MKTSLEEAKRYFELGLNLFDLKDFAGAEEKFAKALSFAPDRISILINLSAVLVQLGKWSDCEEICQKILRLDSQNYDAFLNLSACLSHSNREIEALECLDKAIAINPNSDLAWANKGNLSQELGELTQAANYFEKAISINPLSQEALIGRGNLHNENKEYQLALQDFDAALKLNPSNPQAKWNKALSLLRLGNFAEGWKLYESRWNILGMREHQKYLNTPLWLGRESLQDKTILIYAEQGYGDTIQFARYLSLLEKMGANVLFEVPKPLVDLMKTLSSTINVIENGSVDIHSTYSKIDFQCPVMSLALAFGTTLETIPNQCPYLYVDEVKSRIWGDRLKALSGSKPANMSPFRIGITWAGSGHYAGKKNIKRDIATEEIASLINGFNKERVEFHSLQIEFTKNNELKSLTEHKLFTHNGFLQNFSDTAALISQMDLVVSIDTATAHLAGSLNIPTLLLISDPPDFMALTNRTDTPWYPSSSLMRQYERGVWPLKDIFTSIKQLMQKKTTPEGG